MTYMINSKLKSDLPIGLLAVAVAAVFITLMTGVASPQAQPQVRVTVQVKSGLPNPSWVITNLTDIAQLQTLITGLPTVAPAQPHPFGAFRLVANDAVTGFPKSILVFGGTVEVVNADGTTQFLQDTKGLTEFLVSKATLKCPLTQGFWKNKPNAWPVTSLILGGQTYTESQLLTILGTPPRGDASLILAHQLIAAKLNIANGSLSVPIGTTIAAGDPLLSGFAGTLPYEVKPASATGQAMVNNGTALENFNEGHLTPSCLP